MAKKESKVARGEKTSKKIKEEESEFKEEKVKLSDIVDPEFLYGVKGSSKLHFFRGPAKVHKDHFLLQEWDLDQSTTKPYHLNDIIPLSRVAIRKDENVTGGEIVMVPLMDGFDNLFNKYGDKPLPDEDLRGVLCPQYDKSKFYESVSKKYIKWYNQIIAMVSVQVPDGPPEEQEGGKIITLDK